MWVVAWTGFIAVALAAGRLAASNAVIEVGWVVGFAQGLMAGVFIGLLSLVLAVVIGLVPASVVAFRWSGAALVMPVLVVPMVYASWHRVSAIEIFIAGCLGFWIAAVIIHIFFRRTTGPGRCRDCGYQLIDEQTVCSECGLQRLGETPAFPRTPAAVRAGMKTELRYSGRIFAITLLAIVIIGCTGFAMRARRTEGELKAIVASRALVGLTLEQAADKLRTNSSGSSTTEAEFDFYYLSVWLDWPIIKVKLENGVITEAAYEIEDF